jgi:hypothetical protein
MTNSNTESHPKGCGTIYVDRSGDNQADVRFCLCRFGEDLNECLRTFWDEVPQTNFTIVPVFAHGMPPRRALATARSLASALQVIELEPGSEIEKQWKQLAAEFNVAWPKRFASAA